MKIGDKITITNTSSSGGYGINCDQLGSALMAQALTSLNSEVVALERGIGMAYTWSGSNYKYYIFKVVDVVSIDIPDNISMSIDENYTYNPIITDAEATTTLTWASSNTDVATVNTSGVVTATGVGKATITCTATNGVSAQSLVTVSSVLANSVTMNLQTCEMNVGENIQLVSTIAPANSTSKEIKWISGNDNIAQVDDEGNITAINPGYCNIYAIAYDGSGKYAKCLVHVLGESSVKGDVNGDGGVTAQDASLILQYVAKKIDW